MRLTIPEAAQRLRLSEQTVRRRIKSGELPGVQVSTPPGLHLGSRITRRLTN